MNWEEENDSENYMNLSHDDFMLEMQKKYLDSKDEKIGEVKDALEALKKNPSDPALVKEAFRAAHSLEGGAGSYGFEKSLMPVAEVMSEALRPHYDDKTEVPEELFPFLEECLDLLIETFNKAEPGKDEPVGELPEYPSDMFPDEE